MRPEMHVRATGRAVCCRAVWPALAWILCAAVPAAGQVPLVSPEYGEPPQPTAITVRLLAVAQPTVAFLDRSSRLAEDRAAAKRLRSFARHQVSEQAVAGEVLAAVAAPTPVTRDPLDAAAVGAAAVDEAGETTLSRLPRLLRTPGARAVAADRAIAREGSDDLARLGGLQGRAFDEAYAAAQEDGLRRLVAVYRDYVQNGDDQTLRGVAVHELPRVRARLASLRGFAPR